MAGAAFAGGHSAMMAPPKSTSRGRSNSFTMPAMAATRIRLTTRARTSILKVYPWVCGGILVTNVRNIMVPIKNGIRGESTCACGRSIPSRIAIGIKMARKFFITGPNLEICAICSKIAQMAVLLWLVQHFSAVFLFFFAIFDNNYIFRLELFVLK